MQFSKSLAILIYLFTLPLFAKADESTPCDNLISPTTLDDRSLATIESYLKIPEAILAMAGRLEKLSPTCANKIWPNSGVGSYQTILIDPATKEPWLWRPKGFLNSKDPGGLEKLDPKELEKSPELFRSRYAFTEFREKKTVSLLMGESAFRSFEQEQKEVEKMKKAGRLPPEFELTEEIYSQNKINSVEKDFSTLVHEGFHAYGQGTHHKNDGHDHRWDIVDKQEKNQANGKFDRYSDYPLEPGPRYSRRMQFEAMQMALKAVTNEEKQKYLGEAAYWQDKYKSGSKEHERTNGSDIAEGSAKYFDFMANIYSKFGCQMDDASLKKLIKTELDKLLQQLDKQGGLPPVSDVESYNIGLLANLLLADGAGPEDWKEKVMSGTETPMEILAKGKKRRKGEDNEKAREMILQIQKKNNEEMAGLMTGLTEHLNNKDEWVRLQLPESPGSFAHRGYFKAQGTEGAVIAASATKDYSAENQKIKIENLSLLTMPNGGCPKSEKASSNYILVPKSALRTSDGKTDFSFTDPDTAVIDPKRPLTPTAAGSGEFQVITDSSGAEWYCQK